MNPKAAVIIGTVPGDPVEEIMQELAVANGFEFHVFDAPENAADFLQSSSGLGLDMTLILLCSESVDAGSIPQCAANLRALR